ncbi:MAG: hypothetical protein H7Y86_13080 [Rhizobacter sp.]|nr:hypothetical protein [Ferruginibacter sp.]
MKDRTKQNKPIVIRLPGFVSEEEIGLGTLIKRATTALGIPACNSCEQRARALNSRIVFHGKKH